MRLLGFAAAGWAVGGAMAQGIADPQLTGTWSSKSQSTFTGPDFYDPSSEKMIEPKHTGICYSFTDDGYYEVAYYRAVANPVSPQCPQGIMQWQHGSFEKVENGSLILTPISVDGRQLISDPCTYDNSILTRYNQSELFQRYQIQPDDYHNGILRLDLFQFNGAPLMPLFKASDTPKMLPTTTLNPTNTPTGKGGAAATGASKLKRSLGFDAPPLNHNVINRPKTNSPADHWWWLGVVMTGVGGFLYFCY